MKLKSQIEVLKSIRKPALPANRIERPVRGSGYCRREKWGKRWSDE